MIPRRLRERARARRHEELRGIVCAELRDHEPEARGEFHDLSGSDAGWRVAPSYVGFRPNDTPDMQRFGA